MFTWVFLLCFLGAQALIIPDKEFYDLEKADVHFEEFMKTYNKNYATDDEKYMRFEIFKRNLAVINEKNKRDDSAEHGINKFSDLELKEFLGMYTGFKSSPQDKSPCNLGHIISSRSAPDSFDWRDQNKVTRVKDQSRCNSCWAFSSIGTIEGQYAIVHNETKEFSEQQLVDCVKTSGGCATGGYMTDGVMYAQENGLMTEEDYPYDQRNDKKCRLQKDKVQVKVTACNQYQFDNEDQLKETLYNVGPISIGVAAAEFHTYKGGILKSCKGLINHGVLLVGYGSENDVPFWTIKNSWDTDWGEKGYIRILRNAGLCGIIQPDNQIVSAEVA